MNKLKFDLTVAGCAVLAAVAACTLAAAPLADVAGQAAQLATGAPAGDDSVTVGGVDVVELLILALAALGLGPVARILGLVKPLLKPVLRILLGKRADAPSATPPSAPPSPPTPSGVT